METMSDTSTTRSLDGIAFSEALDRALAASPYTLTGLQAALVAHGHRVSAATLSYWKSGRSLPTRAGSMEVVTAIEELLELPPHSLAAALHSTASPGLALPSLLSDAERPQAVLDEMGLTFHSPYAFDALSDVLLTGTGDGLDHQSVHLLVRADGPGVSRIPLVLNGPAEAGVPQLTVTRGARLGRTVALDDLGTIVCEVLLPHELAVGERQWVDYEVEWPVIPGDDNSHSRTITRPCTFLTIGAVFAAERPTQVRLTHRGPDDDESQVVTSWSPVDGEVQYTLRNAPPGAHALEWDALTPA